MNEMVHMLSLNNYRIHVLLLMIVILLILILFQISIRLLPSW